MKWLLPLAVTATAFGVALLIILLFATVFVLNNPCSVEGRC